MAIKLCEHREEVMTDTFWLNYLNLRKVDQKVKFYPLIWKDATEKWKSQWTQINKKTWHFWEIQTQ